MNPNQNTSLPNGSKTVLFIRHGETALSQDEDQFCGTLDPDLTEAGREQALRASQTLVQIVPRIELAWTSPLRRASQSASLISQAQPWEIVKDLRELSFGDWEGLNKAAARAAAPQAYAAWEADAYLNPPPGGEAGNEAKRRAERVLDKIAGTEAQTIVIVSHKTFLRILIGVALGLPLGEVRKRIEIHTGKVGVLEVTGRRGKLKALNL